MARRAAAFTQTDMDRAAKAAAKVGYVMEIRPGSIRLVPSRNPAENSPVGDCVDAESETAAWDAALA
jgi:hypothetical protein